MHGSAKESCVLDGDSRPDDGFRKTNNYRMLVVRGSYHDHSKQHGLFGNYVASNSQERQQKIECYKPSYDFTIKS